jgi:inner membrane protein
MDNLAHTLAGLALAEAGLKRRTALATPTLVIAANLPDIDAISYLIGQGADSLAFRRGWTHGPIAMVVLPLVLTGVMVLWDRAFRDRPGRRHVPVFVGWLFIVAMIGAISHPLLDLLNSYGVRLLMPFSDEWFYGDALFIIDPWLWATLALGVFFSRRRARRERDAGAGIASRRRPSREIPTSGRWVTRPARLAIAAVVLYALAMAGTGRIGRLIVARQSSSGEATRAMVGPVALTPFRRDVVREIGDHYETGTLLLGLSPTFVRGAVIEKESAAPGVAAAKQTREGAAFLSWARFPRFITEPVGDSIRVRISDLRYTDRSGRGWATVVVMVPAESVVPSGTRLPGVEPDSGK